MLLANGSHTCHERDVGTGLEHGIRESRVWAWDPVCVRMGIVAKKGIPVHGIRVGGSEALLAARSAAGRGCSRQTGALADPFSYGTE